MLIYFADFRADFADVSEVCALCCDGRVVSIALGTHPKTSRSARTAPRSTGTRFGRSALRSGAAHCQPECAKRASPRIDERHMTSPTSVFYGVRASILSVCLSLAATAASNAAFAALNFFSAATKCSSAAGTSNSTLEERVFCE